jgi:hypothetical protein
MDQEQIRKQRQEEEQREKMDLLKEFFRAAGRNNISLFTELNARQKVVPNPSGGIVPLHACVDQLYKEIEEGTFKL